MVRTSWRALFCHRKHGLTPEDNPQRQRSTWVHLLVKFTIRHLWLDIYTWAYLWDPFWEPGAHLFQCINPLVQAKRQRMGGPEVNLLRSPDPPSVQYSPMEGDDYFPCKFPVFHCWKNISVHPGKLQFSKQENPPPKTFTAGSG